MVPVGAVVGVGAQGGFARERASFVIAVRLVKAVEATREVVSAQETPDIAIGVVVVVGNGTCELSPYLS